MLCGTPKVRPVASHSSSGNFCPNAKPAVASAVYQRAMPR